MPVRQIPRLLEECWRNRARKSGIVNRLHRNIVIDLPTKLPRKACNHEGYLWKMAHVPLSQDNGQDGVRSAI